MSVGSCKSCSPVLDAVRLAANPKADLNKDGKISAAELQETSLTNATQTDNRVINNSDTLKADARNKNDARNQPDTTYRAQFPSILSSNNILLLAQSFSNE